MSDLIRIVDLEVSSQIGVPDEERAHAQKLLILIDMEVDCVAQAAISDDVAQTVNYYDVAQKVKALAAKRPRKLLETLAEEITTDLLKNSSIKAVTIEIKKFILSDARHVSVKITRPK
jgi:dihydroneopterin aldolase